MSRRLPMPPHSSHQVSRSQDSTSSTLSGDVQKTVHCYSLTAGSAELQFIITIEPVPDRPLQHYFFLTLKAGAVERPICQPVMLKLRVDPRDLKFAVFVFPPKTSLPQGCLWSLRVWLRCNGVDHRVFSDDSLWIGKDPDFYSIEDATFARLRSSTLDTHLYKAALGSMLVDYIVRWQHIAGSMYSISLEYDGHGVGRVLFSDLLLRLDCPVAEIAFVIYTIPVSSTPQGATHRLRVWLKAPAVTTLNGPAPASITQRIWTMDDFRIGHDLDFKALGAKMVMGIPSPGGPLSVMSGESTQSLFSKDDKAHPGESSRTLYNKEGL
ncbi:hypothetical protein FA95DRAFT_479976 [Auriscalpium vulgare]|uniref:Uncharacterized protein n=1 Tax=Auriscalpium vulgare TaxID=40419 RepID=A0ACB8SCS8_9AGAM|nr:hypothetical protein FA95DRAFT_479976 [Auriscalpium vulgare]